MLYIGIDLGTSAVKLLLMDAKGNIGKIVTKEYPLEFPKPGWSQQRPEDWKATVLDGLAELTVDCDKSKIAGMAALSKSIISSLMSMMTNISGNF